MLMKYKNLLFTLLMVFSYAAYADTNHERWYTNYKNPSYFIKSNNIAIKDSSIMNPEDNRISGYIFEIDNNNPSISMEYIVEGLNKFLTSYHIQATKVIDSPKSYIFFMPKNNIDNQKVFYKRFAQAISWLLFNRRDTKVAIRPIMKKESHMMFQASQVIYMDPPKVLPGHYHDAFVDPEKTIVDGFHIHMDYLENQKAEASQLLQQFKTALLHKSKFDHPL